VFQTRSSAVAEIMRRFVSLNIWAKLLEVIQNENVSRACVSPY